MVRTSPTIWATVNAFPTATGAKDKYVTGETMVESEHRPGPVRISKYLLVFHQFGSGTLAVSRRDPSGVWDNQSIAAGAPAFGPACVFVPSRAPKGRLWCAIAGQNGSVGVLRYDAETKF